MIQIYLQFTKFLAKSAKEEELFEFFQEEAAKYVNTLSGCIEYRILKDNDNPNVICVLESWQDAASHDASLNDSKVKELISQGMQLIDTVLGQERLTE